jgi:hypothetical protein
MTREDDDVRIAAIRDSISARLRPVCEHWPNELFDEMVIGLAQITVKYEGTVTAGTYDRRTTDRLVADLKAALERNEIARRTSHSGPQPPLEEGA